MRRRLAAAAVALLLASAAGCDTGGDPAPSPSPTTTTLATLGTAIRGINSTRQAVLTDLATIVEAAKALDRVDESAAAGDRSRAGTLRTQLEAAVKRRDVADGRIQANLAKYAAAIDTLERAGKPADLAAEHRRVIQDVVRAARQEFAADTRFVNVSRSAWPAYVATGETYRTWATRARAGWYRNAKEAGDAYAVLVIDARPRLEAARTAFQQADAGRAAATSRMSKAIDAARGVLAVLG